MRLFLILLVTAVSWPSVSAQQVGRVEGRQASPGGYYVNALPGEPTTRVHVWGDVRLPGVYEVGRGFDLAAVLSLAGGPAAVSTQEAERVRDAERFVRVYRDQGDGEPVYEARVQDFLTDVSSHPELRDGDTIVTSRSGGDLRVYVWGAVRSPGLYEVGPGYDGPALLSLAGGPQVSTIRNRDVRTTNVKVLRPGVETPLYEAPLDRFARDGGALALQNGDVIEVEIRDRTPWSFRDTATVIGAAAGVLTAVALAVDRLSTN